MNNLKTIAADVWDSMLARCALLGLACGVFPFWMLSMAAAAIKR